MPRIRLVPTGDPEMAFEYIGPDAGSAFSAAGQRNFHEAQIWVNENYLCTLRRATEAQGAFWMILQDPRLNARAARVTA